MRDMFPKMRQIIVDSIVAVFQKIDPNRRLNCFEIYGYDFMIDEDLNVWLIEVNTNPCLETSSIHLARIIPNLIDNAL
jgi:D-alanine-D-alanine ligase-like ATP-grasp enzyme